MFNYIELAICFLFLIAVWKHQMPSATEDISLAVTKPGQKREDFH